MLERKRYDFAHIELFSVYSTPTSPVTVVTLAEHDLPNTISDRLHLSGLKTFAFTLKSLYTGMEDFCLSKCQIVFPV